MRRMCLYQCLRVAYSLNMHDFFLGVEQIRAITRRVPKYEWKNYSLYFQSTVTLTYEHYMLIVALNCSHISVMIGRIVKPTSVENIVYFQKQISDTISLAITAFVISTRSILTSWSARPNDC